jgi:chromosome segregation protein
MQLLSISINGFKSFAKPTKLDFAAGITAVVGPNGCGKSNVVDALRWVLGEQRSSILRSERMENVIFNGTVVRKPSGMAEARILFDNSQSLLNVPYAEVEIARRLYRDGTSEYLLNNNECRLKDITDLLHDSGMGPNLYTILELKMVEEILREDGEGRRALFEEAAGVAKYKIRRRQALQKLRQTEEDLVRLADIVSEVERQVSSLKRQAMRARKYDEYSKQLRALEGALIYREYLRLKGDLAPLEDAMQASSASSDAVRSAIRLEESKLLELRTREINCEKETSAARKLLTEIAAEISALEAEEAGLRARQQAAQQTIERSKREQQLFEDKRVLLEMRKAEAEKNEAESTGELTVASEKVANAMEALAAAEETWNEADNAARIHTELVSGLRHRAAECQRDISHATVSKAGIVSRIEFMQSELHQLNDERGALQTKLRETKELYGGVEAQEQLIHADEQRLLNELQSRKSKLSLAEEFLRKLISMSEGAKNRADLLRTLEERGPRSHSALRALKSKPVDGLIELLGDAVVVDEPYQRAIQAVLGPAAYYYLAESMESALAAMEMLRRESAGQTTFLAITEFQTDDIIPMDPPIEALGSALTLLKVPPDNAVIAHYLSRVIVVNDWQTALQLYPWARSRRCTLVTLDGQWIGSDGLLRGGSEDIGLPVDLGLTKQLSELDERLGQIAADREQTAQAIRQSQAEIAETEQTISKVRREIDHFTDERLKIREQQVKIETRLVTLDERENASQSQIVELSTEAKSWEERIDILQNAAGEADRVLKEAEMSAQDIQLKAVEEQRRVALAKDYRHACERERDAVQHKLDLMTAEHQRIVQSLQENDEEHAIALQSAELAAEDLIKLAGRLQEIDDISVAKYRRRDEMAAEVDKVSQRLDETRNLIAEQEDRLRALRDSHAGELEGSRRIELEVARLRGELDALIANARTQHNLEVDNENFLIGHPELDHTESSAELLQECRQKIDRLGPINSLAIEEYEQENTRLELMLKQRDDLLKAKSTLEETIARINETAQARFLHTFEAVRSHFQRLFQEFFVAGEADLILSGPDLLDADITLWANPSGKRLKSLSLMSGGEKTMTAIALLFALYQVKPSPFCVFDEVDAPLDDANIDRFNRVIRMHAEHTQFILVTHNRRTMEIADNLYGVTMEEEGISKLVSVRLMSSVSQP